MSRPYDAYRASDVPWVERIPSGWQTVPLFSVLEETKVKNAGLVESNLLSLSYGRIVRKDIEAVGGLLPESFETYQIVEPDQLVFRFTDLQNDQRSLRSARALERGIITSAYASARPKGIEPRFAEYLMRSYDTTKVFYGLGGGVRQSLKFSDVARLPVLLPTSAEQRAIADYLDRETARIDTLIEEQQRLIVMLRERRTAVVAHATSHGSDVEFRRVIAALRQGWSPNCENSPADGVVEWGVLKVGCANTGRFDPTENKRLPAEETPRPELAVRQGDLIMSRSNTKDLVGAAAVVDGVYPRLLLSDLTYSISLTADAHPAFVAYALGSPSMRAQISAASKGMSHSMQKISQRDIRELRLRLPALDEQNRVVAYLDEQTAKIDQLVSQTERFIELSRERRAALITAAVTGQIDPREVA